MGTKYPVILMYLLGMLGGYVFAQPAVYRNEKIYLRLETREVSAADTLRAQGWLVESQTFAPSLYSRYVYVELLDNRDSAVVRQKIAVSGALFRVRLPIDAFQAPGSYYLRAYTRFMRNQPEWTFPLLAVQIGQPASRKEAGGREKEIHTVRFYPEGGNLVGDCLQQLVFEVNGPGGCPVEAKGELLDSKGNIRQSNLYTDAAGRGCIRAVFRKDETYRLRLYPSGDSGVSRVYPLPPAGDTPSLQLNTNRGTLRYALVAAPGDTAAYRFALFFRGIFLLEDTLSPCKATGMVDLSTYPSGIVAGLLQDAEKRPIAERLLFHQGKEYGRQPTEVTLFTTDKEIYKSGEIVQIKFTQPDTAACYQIRMQTLREGEEAAGEGAYDSFAGGKMASYLLLTSEFPAGRFSFPPLQRRDSGESRRQLDRWLMANRWKRFSLFEVWAGKCVYPFSPERNSLLEGRVETELGNPLKGGSLIAVNTDTGFTYEGGIDATGRFRVAVDDFADGQTFFMQAYDRKGKTFGYKVIPDPATYPGVDNRLKPYSAEKELEADSLSSSSVRIASGGISVSVGENEEKNYRLPEIEVAARIRKEAPETQDFYFQRKITEEIIRKRSYPDMLPYLQDLSGIRVGKVSLNPNAEEGDLSVFRYAIFTTRGAAVLRKTSDPYQRQPGELPVLLDGSLVDTHHVLTTLDPQNVASIERLTPGQALAYTSFGFDGAILITTRDYRKEKPESKGILWHPLGLSPADDLPAQLPDSLVLPRRPGAYRVIVEGIDGSGVPRYEEKQIVVQE